MIVIDITGPQNETISVNIKGIIGTETEIDMEEIEIET